MNKCKFKCKHCRIRLFQKRNLKKNYLETTKTTIEYQTIPCNTIQYHTIPCNTIQYHAIPFDIMQYHAIPCHKTHQKRTKLSIVLQIYGSNKQSIKCNNTNKKAPTYLGHANAIFLFDVLVPCSVTCSLFLQRCILFIVWFVSSDRSSHCDDGLLYVRSSSHFFRFSLSPLHYRLRGSMGFENYKKWTKVDTCLFIQ